MPRSKPEDQLHRAVAQYLALQLKPPVIWTTIEPGGRGKVRGAQLKAKGVKPGWPDILIVAPVVNGPCVVGIELKADKGRPSKAQMEMASAFDAASCLWFLCRSIEGVKMALQESGLIR